MSCLLANTDLSRRLVLNGMKLQECRPSFFDARDAIIQADQILTGGENFCDLWLGFGERGLGSDADVKGKTPWGGGIRTDVSTQPIYRNDICESAIDLTLRVRALLYPQDVVRRRLPSRLAMVTMTSEVLCHITLGAR